MSVEDYRRGGSIRFDQKWYQDISAVSVPRQTIKNGEILPISKLLEMFSSRLVRLARIGLQNKNEFGHRLFDQEQCGMGCQIKFNQPYSSDQTIASRPDHGCRGGAKPDWVDHGRRAISA
jgi:hypothetical protein